jgi:hypothetical protein
VYQRCRECHRHPVSGLWRVTSATRDYHKLLCAQCGLTDYVKARVFFIPTIRIDLVKSFTTEFRQSQTPTSRVPEKHWAEHSIVPEARGIGSKPLTELLTNAKRKKHHSTVSSSILENYRHD